MKNLATLFRGITSRTNGDLCCLHYLHLFKTKNKLEKHKNTWKDYKYCHIEMPEEV